MFVPRVANGSLVLVAGLLALGGGACRARPASPPPVEVVRIGGGFPAAAIAAVYAHGSTGVGTRFVPPSDPISVVDRIEQGEVDAGVAFADVAYLSYSRQPARSRLRTLASLSVTPLFLVVRGGANIHTVADLRHARVWLTAPSATTDPRFTPPLRVPLSEAAGAPAAEVTALSELVLAGYGIEKRELNAVAISATQSQDAFRRGEIDAIFTTASGSEAFIREMGTRGARLVPLDGPATDRLRRKYPFIQHVRIPANTYPGQSQPLHTIGVGLLFLCRADLDATVAYLLTKGYVEALTTLAANEPALRRVRVEDAPVVPVPLHIGAAQYYRQWELFR